MTCEVEAKPHTARFRERRGRRLNRISESLLRNGNRLKENARCSLPGEHPDRHSLEVEGELPKQAVEKGEWIRSPLENNERSALLKVPVPLFQQAAKGGGVVVGLRILGTCY